MDTKNAASDVLDFQISRAIINNSKSFLNILESLLEKGYHFDYNKYRKEILDTSNDKIRELEELMKKFEIKLK